MKKKLLAVIMSVLCLAAVIPVTPVFADGQKVVTLGADLSEEQKQAILRYFGIAGQNIQTLTITNQDERDHLGAYVPLEQIGTKTFSCALVNPTTSGGIQVKTANLSWVTSNMIATTLSTSGVVNCEVLAAAPFEVSGTGALTGILMAYESAVGMTLDSTKKEVATQELITTTTIASTLGQTLATDIVNESKKQIIQGNVVSSNEINVVIDEVAADEGIALTEEDRQLLIDLMEQIADQDYEYEDMQETLDRVEANLDEFELEDDETADDSVELAAPASDSTQSADDITVIESVNDAAETLETLAADSILMNTDDSALGESVIFDATDSAALDDSSDEEDVDDTVGTAALPEDATQAPVDVTVIPSESTDDTTSDVQEEIWTDSTTVEPTIPAETPADGTAAEGEDGMLVIPDDPADVTVIPDDSTQSEVPETGAEPVTLNLDVIPLTDMKFYPLTAEANGYQVHQAGINELVIDVARTEVIGGTGTLTLYNAVDSSVVETINMNDTSKVNVADLPADELTEYGWSTGSRVIVKLASPLAPLTAYYVMLTDDAIQTADGIGTSAATQDSYSWTLNTGEYGFYISDTLSGIKAGVPVNGQIMMEGELVTYACIENADPAMVTFDMTEFLSSGSFTATFNAAGTTSFLVSFYSEEGTCLYSITYEVTVNS